MFSRITLVGHVALQISSCEGEYRQYKQSKLELLPRVLAAMSGGLTGGIIIGSLTMGAGSSFVIQSGNGAQNTSTHHVHPSVGFDANCAVVIISDSDEDMAMHIASDSGESLLTGHHGDSDSDDDDGTGIGYYIDYASNLSKTPEDSEHDSDREHVSDTGVTLPVAMGSSCGSDVGGNECDGSESNATVEYNLDSVGFLCALVSSTESIDLDISESDGACDEPHEEGIFPVVAHANGGVEVWDVYGWFM